ncbi:MAG TPA: right-handed parallel beta-helix repeat-containing protein [Paracoccaceae bacterium]|nr:right-handed parallel beta-helix repeat-containing protein [Paracoccaceae bacterium]
MLRLLATLPAVFATRALADGSSGTLGRGSVGAHELRPGAVTLETLADMPGGRVLGRGSEGAGTPRALAPAELRALVEAGAVVPEAPDRPAAEALSPAPEVAAIRLLGRESAGDGGGALFVRSGAEPEHAGKLRTADGTWWRIAGGTLSPRAFGAAADGATDDTAAFAAAADAAGRVGAALVGAPSETYRLTAPVPLTHDGLHLEGRGARIEFLTADSEAFEVGDGLAPVHDVEVTGWTARFLASRSALIRARRAVRLRVTRNRVEDGHLVYTSLPSDSAGLTGAAWSPSQPDVAAIAPEDLCVDLVVSDNHVDGGPENYGATPRPDLSAGIRLNWIDGATVERNRVSSHRSGILWWGGDSNPARDGGVGSRRLARRLRISANRVADIRLGGIWGSQGQDLVVTGNVVERCGDICIHGEGDADAVYDGNVAREGRNGCYTPYFVCERTIYSDNVAVIEDAAFSVDPGGRVMIAKWNNADNARDMDVRFVGNHFEVKDTSLGLGLVEIQNGGTCTFDGNTLVNVRIDCSNDSGNGGVRAITGNRMRFTAAVAGPFAAIEVGRLVAVEPQAMHAVIRDNVIDASAMPAIDPASAAVRIVQWATATHVVARNQEMGFPVFATTESLTANGAQAVRLTDNLVSGIPHLDLTDRAALPAIDLAVLHRGAGRSVGVATPWAAGEMPRHGLWAAGSRGDWSAPDAGGHLGFVAVTGGAGTLGPWDAGTAYALWDQVTGSDGAVHLAVAPAPSGAAADPVSGVDRALYWRRVAPARAVFRAAGAVTP